MLNFAIVLFGINVLAYFIRGPEIRGPFGVVDKFRHFIGLRYDEFSELYGENPIAEGLTCSICGPIWIAIFIAPLFYFWPKFTAILFFPLAVGRLSVLIDTLTND